MKKSMNMGGSIVSKNILENKGRIRWVAREEGVNHLDNGWRFLSEIDTDEFLQQPSSMVVCDWGTIFDIEPAIMPIFEMPVGTELTLIYEGDKRVFVDTYTEEPVLTVEKGYERYMPRGIRPKD